VKLVKLERPSWDVIRIGLIQHGYVTCPREGYGKLNAWEARKHYDAGHFDRAPLDTSNLPPARRILGRGAGPKNPSAA
jgi:hypothetical protein